MSEPTKIPDAVRIVAEQRGLGHALQMFPEGVVAAAERGLRPLGKPPAGTSPTDQPAGVFDPAQFEREP